MKPRYTNLFLLLLLFFASLFAQDGTVDTNFGTNGYVMTQILPETDLKTSEARDVVIQTDGKILASGIYDQYGRDAVALVRYNADGSLDLSFGENGIVRSYFVENEVVGGVTGLGLQSDGKIIVSGSANNATDYDVALMRFDVNGKVDSSFGINGRVLTPVGPSHDYSTDMVILSDDKILLTGSTHNSLEIDGIVIKYTPEGELDNSFGNGGIVITDFSGGADDFTTIAAQSNGKVVVAGYSNNTVTGKREFALAKYNSDGSLDASFDEDGMMTIGSFLGQILSIQLLNQNQILFVGGTSGGSKVALGRVNADGKLDNTFGTDGLLETNFLNSISDNSVKLLVQNDNKFIVIATTWQSGPYIMSGQRFNSDGSVDDTFGDVGAFFIDLNAQDYSRSNSAVIAQDGSIFVAGETLTDKRITIFSILKINNSSAPLTDVQSDNLVAKDFSLSQNYPNPFNPSTIIKFSIPQSAFVSLKVFDVLGKEVAILVNDYLSAGTYSTLFEASSAGKNLSSGVYFYRIETNQFSQTKKFMLMK